MVEEAQEQEMYIDLISRIRTIEGKYNLLRDRTLVINQNMVLQHKKLLSNINMMDDDIKQLKSEIFQITETLKHALKDINQYATKGDVRVLEKYITFWNPLKFVTEEEVINLLEEHKKKVK
ncbi:hypothetical protein J4436_03460 [Candidatus Woesearchaeota archaeon]|nr:hypothetical protein [Candidatus Woesearchaeota archaeon]